MSSRLSVCFLTRDEQRNIERAIRSVEGIADEVIVIDTGSTDQTESIAKSRGARVFSFSWDDDFAAGRNAALERASGEWILWLNPDEELIPGYVEPLRALIQSRDEVLGYLTRVRSIPRKERLDQFSEVWDLRLFRKQVNFRYVGRLHPTFSSEVLRAAQANGQVVATSEIAIRHHAYQSVLDESKLRWTIRLIEKELSERPGQLHYQVELAQNLLRLRDDRGHEVMAQAIARHWPERDASEPPGSDAQILLEYALTTPPALNRSALSTDQAVNLALRWFSSSPPLLWAIADGTFRTGRYEASVVMLERLVSLGLSGTWDRSRPFDPRIVGSWALLNLGQCYRALGRIDEARHAFDRLRQDIEFAARSAELLAQLDAPSS
ncbi:MAG: glycosyltransferase family 2 protein [Isosphaeraceae bacterium]